MAIYNIFDFDFSEEKKNSFAKKAEQGSLTFDASVLHKHTPSKDRFFSALAARFFFLLLLVVDIGWFAYTFCALCVKSVLCLMVFGQISSLKQTCKKSYLSLKRSIVCAIALTIAIFSPALGIMFSCMYFLMYDKKGVDEVVPTSLKDPFEQIFSL